MLRCATNDAWETLMGRLGLIFVVLVDGGLTVAVVIATTERSTEVQALWTASSILGIPVVVWLALFVWHLRRPIRRWAPRLDQSPTQLLFQIQSLEFQPIDELTHFYCTITTPSGAEYRDSDYAHITDIRRGDTFGFDYPREFEGAELEEGTYKLRWTREGVSDKSPCLVLEHEENVRLPEEPAWREEADG